MTEPEEASASNSLRTLLPVSRFERFLAAIQSATLAALLALLWYAITARFDGQSVWTVPNLISGFFYGMGSLRPDFTIRTLSGISFHLLLYVIFGALYSQLIPPTLRITTSLFLGILAATSWFYLLDGFFWRRVFPPFAVFSKRPSIFLSFVLLGICVGLYSVFVRSFHDRANSV